MPAALSHATQQRCRAGQRTLAGSFNHLVGAGDELPRYVEAERFGRLEVDDQLHSRNLLDRQVARLLALEDTTRIAAGEPVRLRHIAAIARQAAGSSKFPRIEDRGDAIAKRERCKSRTLADQE